MATASIGDLRRVSAKAQTPEREADFGFVHLENYRADITRLVNLQGQFWELRDAELWPRRSMRCVMQGTEKRLNLLTVQGRCPPKAGIDPRA
jgi:hypothetical protein